MSRHRSPIGDSLDHGSSVTADALEPNVFYEPMLAVPAVERFTAGKRLEFVCVYYHVNHQLHRLKLPVSPVGRSRLADEAKYRAFRTLRHASRLLGGWREHGGRRYQ